MTYLAPGQVVGPFFTSFFNQSKLNGVTLSGKVSVKAIDLGTPTCSVSRFASPPMTLRAQKSTRFPIRLPRNRPSLDFKRSRIDFKGRFDFVVAWGIPIMQLSLSVKMWY